MCYGIIIEAVDPRKALRGVRLEIPRPHFENCCRILFPSSLLPVWNPFTLLAPTQVRLFWSLREAFSHHLGPYFLYLLNLSGNHLLYQLSFVLPGTTFIYLWLASLTRSSPWDSSLTCCFFALAIYVRSWGREIFGGFWWILGIFGKKESFGSIIFWFFWYCKLEQKSLIKRLIAFLSSKNVLMQFSFIIICFE